MSRLYNILFSLICVSSFALTAQADDNTVFSCIFEKIGDQVRAVTDGGTIDCKTRIQEVSLDPSGSVSYNTAYLNPIVNNSIVITLESELDRFDEIYFEGFNCHSGSSSENSNMLMTVDGCDPYQVKGFKNIYNLTAGEANPSVIAPIIVDKNMKGHTKITLKVDGSSKTLYLTKILIKHNPDAPRYISVTPEPDKLYDIFTETSKISVKTNFKAEYLYINLFDTLTPDISLLKDVDGSPVESGGEYVYNFTINEDLVLYEGHTYAAVFTAEMLTGPVPDPYEVYYSGEAKLPYSEVKLSAQSPEVSSVITSASDNVVSLTFSGEANLSKVDVVYAGKTVPAVNFTSNNAEKNIWSVTVPEIAVTDSLAFALNVYATDADGLTICDGAANTQYVTATFLCNVPRSLTVYPSNAQPLLLLDEFTFSYADGIKSVDLSKKITLAKGEQTIDGKMSDEAPYAFVLDTPQTSRGAYTLTIPEGMFKLGIGFNNVEMTINYTVKPKENQADITWNPDDAPGTPITTLKSFNIDFSKAGYVEGFLDKQMLYKHAINLYSVDNLTDSVSTVKKFENFDNKPVVYCEFDPNISVKGTYILKIPKEVFWLSKDINYLSYDPNEEMEFEVTVVKNEDEEASFGVIIVSPKIGSTVRTLDSVSIYFENSSSLEISENVETTFDVYKISDVEGENDELVDSKAVLRKASSDGRPKIHLYFEPDITKYGTYKTIIPENTLVLWYSGDSPKQIFYDRDWEFTYTVDPQSGVEDIFIDPIDSSMLDDDAIVEVYNLQGMLIRRAPKAEAFDGLHGLYIVNGKKLYLR